jgi:hypothetical protein
LNAKLRNGLIIGGGIVVALVAGWQIGNESLLLAGLLGGGLLLFFGTLLSGVRPDAFVAGIVLAGYLIGNRGFAQLSIPNLPLLPGELTLGLGLFMAVWDGARAKYIPVRRDAMNGLLLIWLAFGAMRFGIDVRAHGMIALRDFAIVYYALFFFLAQGWWQDPGKRRWIERCLTTGFALGAPVFLAFAQWPDFFVNHLSVRGVPLIFVKSDVQAGLLVAGTYWFLHRYLASRRIGWLLLAATNLIGVALANSRAALVALGATLLWILVCRVWQLLRPLAGLFTAGVLLLLAAPVLTQSPWKESLAYRFYETTASIADYRGARTYARTDLSDKPDNNLFRLTWWRAVAEETWTEGRWLGLGFGYDLSDQFTRIYYAEGSEEFSARSPHNYLLTIFGRSGLVGLGMFLLFLAATAVQTWRTGRQAAREEAPNVRFTLLIGVWGILISACFGVVLEGPMGASIFWTLLGLASAARQETEPAGETDPESVTPALPAEPERTHAAALS